MNKRVLGITRLAFAVVACICMFGLNSPDAIATDQRVDCDISAVRPEESVEQRMERLGRCVNDTTAETGGGSAPRHLYKYDDFEFEDCSINLREYRKLFDGKSLLESTVDDVTVPLATVNPSSVRIDKAGASAWGLSFSAQDLRNTINIRSKISRGNDEVEQTRGMTSGYGLYFQKRAVAAQASKILTSAIRACRQAKSN